MKTKTEDIRLSWDNYSANPQYGFIDGDGVDDLSDEGGDGIGDDLGTYAGDGSGIGTPVGAMAGDGSCMRPHHHIGAEKIR